MASDAYIMITCNACSRENVQVMEMKIASIFEITMLRSYRSYMSQFHS